MTFNNNWADPFYLALCGIIKIIWPFIVLGILFSIIASVPHWLKDKEKAGRNRSYRVVRVRKTLNLSGFPWHDPRTCMKIIDLMDGFEFEEFLSLLFKKLGYHVEVTPEIKDHGADLIIADSQGRRYAVQAKKLTHGRVGTKALGELFRGLHWYKCNGGIILTNRFFTDQAKEEAKRLNIALWDRPKLIELIKKAHQTSH